MNERQLVAELRVLRRLGVRSATPERLPMLLALAERREMGNIGDFGEAVASAVTRALRGYSQHALGRIALEVLGLEPRTIGLSPGAARGVSVTRTRGSDTPDNRDAFAKNEEAKGLAFLAGHLLASLDAEPGSEIDPANARVTHLTTDFYRDIPWSRLLTFASEIDILFTYGRTWRRSLTAEFGEVERSSRPVSMRVVLPDTEPPTDTALPEIAKRAGLSIPRLTDSILEARDFFLSRLGAAVYLMDAAELYAMYRFDDVIVVSMYNHQQGQTAGVPTLACERGGSFYQYFRTDFEAIVDPSRKLSRRFDG